MREIRARGYILRRLESKELHMFRSMFGISLHDFWDTYIGFDIVKFNDALGVPDDESVANFLLEHYGEEARDFVKMLNETLAMEVDDG